MPTYSEQQVTRFRKQPGKRPTLNRGEQVTEITEDFEAWLILLPEATRALISNWISTVLTLFYGSAGGFDSMTVQLIQLEWALDEAAEVQLQLTNLRRLTEPWDLVKKDIMAPPQPGTDFTDLPEIQQMIDDIGEGMGAIGSYQYQLEHQSSIATRLATDLAKSIGGMDTDGAFKALLNSYVQVLVAYTRTSA